MSSVARVVLSAVMLAALTSIQLVASPSATADVTALCKGYTGCAQQGMSDAGYGRASGAMYWRMYAGHNCTNYVAYRMVQAGLPNVRPWEGSGNATYWGSSLPDLTDGVPAVGAVAWWRAGVYPAGSAGHVAYVERVVDADTIVVSQDSWGGDFSWARITRSSRGWPSGFIHLDDAPLTNTTPPTVDGTAKVGSTLSATPGTWSPAATVAYQWRSGGADVPGATEPTFTPTASQIGARVRVLVTAARPGYPTARALSPRTAPVLPGTLASTAAPAVSGSPVVDGTLTAAPGSWTPTPDRTTFQWLADGAPIAGATGEVLTPDAVLVGRALSVRVTASRDGYADVSVSSAATDPVTRADFAEVTEPALTGTPRLGQVLALSTGAATPEGTPTVQWLRDGKPVAGASGPSYPLTRDDLGSRISAAVRWDRDGYVPQERRTAPTSWVKAPPTVDVRVRPRDHRARVRVEVSAPDGTTLPAQVWLRSGRTRLALPLEAGTAVTVLTQLPPGTRNLRVIVPPTRTLAALLWTGEVTTP